MFALLLATLPVRADTACDPGSMHPGPLSGIEHFVIVFQENWSFDGIAQAIDQGATKQLDRLSRPLTTLPASEKRPSIPAGLPVRPYDLGHFLPADGRSRDIVHRFYTEQLQIGNGVLEAGTRRNDKFVTWSDNGSLVMSYYDARQLPMGRWAKEYTLADHFFHAAYGGSFLNHQFLIAAVPPVWAQPTPNTARFVSRWDVGSKRLMDGNLTRDGHYVVNTTFPAQGPHPKGIPAEQLLRAINNSDPRQPGYTPTIGNRLDEKGISWRWYAGGWQAALEGRAKGFQYHHQPFAYFTRYAPFDREGWLRPLQTSRHAHLQDEARFIGDLNNGALPTVSFIKPIGRDNEHPGYASLLAGQKHVEGLVEAIYKSPYWAKTAIIVTYDENGGRWDHVPPPVRDEWGPGTRVPTLILSPLARRHYIDHTPYDTLSILKTLEVRFNLKPLNERDGAANSLVCAFQ